MYHGRFNGTHYEIGFKWGSLLLKKGKRLLDVIPFELKEEHFKFSEKCVPYYEKFFPEILEEIRGIADGQQCSYKKLTAFLLNMYCVKDSVNCSCFAVKNDENIFLGRNSDFLTILEKEYMNCIYKFKNKGYSFTGNTTAFVQMEDGINEHGFSAGLTFVYPAVLKPGLNSGMILRLLLEKCRTVEEALNMIREIPTASSQTFVFADVHGSIALVESNCEKTEIKNSADKNNFVCSVNRFFTDGMKKYNKENFDDWQAEERYSTLKNCLNLKSENFTLKNAEELLSGKNGFICQYDRKTGKDTVWSVIYDLKNKNIYRAEGNPLRKKFKKDERFSII